MRIHTPAYQTMLRKRAIPWGEEPTIQPLARCIDHVISMMIHTMEIETAGTDNQSLTEQEAVTWLKAKDLYGFYEKGTYLG